MSHDWKPCDIYKKFKWHKQASTSPELQLHYTMRPLLLINSTKSFLDFILAKILVRYHSLLVSALLPSQKFVLHIDLMSPSPLVVILSNSPQPTSGIQSILLPLGRLKQQYKCPKHSKLSPTSLSLPRQCENTTGDLV